MQKRWTDEEKQYLSENWGSVSINTICAKLNRSRSAVTVMKNRMKLGAFLESGDYVTFNRLLTAIGYKDSGYNYKLTSWIKNRNFPLKYKKAGSSRFRVVYLEDFWKWAEKNRHFIDLSGMERNALGKEPDWVEEIRRNRQRDNLKFRRTPWTKYEDERLKYLLSQYKYGYAELSQMLGRTAGAVQRRCADLGLKERPVRAVNHVKWRGGDLEKLPEMIKSGFTYELMAERFGRSSKAVRGLVYRIYRTENLDKVLAKL